MYRDDSNTFTEAFQSGMCIGFITGWMYSIAGETTDGNAKWVTSFKDGVTTGQIVRVFLKYIRLHPELENQPSVYVLVQAMMDVKLMLVEKKIDNASVH